MFIKGECREPNSRPRLFMKKKNCAVLLVLFLICGCYYGLSAPYLIVESETADLIRIPVKVGDYVSLRYTHSVQKTLVIENIIIDKTGSLIVDSTEYESFGVGLPFLASEGNFRHSGNRFILEDMGRCFKVISLRTGPEAQLRMQYKDQIYELYSMVPDGALIRMRVAPYYSTWLNNSHSLGG